MYSGRKCEASMYQFWLHMQHHGGFKQPGTACPGYGLSLIAECCSQF